MSTLASPAALPGNVELGGPWPWLKHTEDQDLKPKRLASPALELFLISVAKLILTWQKTVLIAVVFPSWLPDVSKRT